MEGKNRRGVQESKIMVHWSDIYDTYEEYLAARQSERQRDLGAARGIMFAIAFSLPIWIFIAWWVL